MCCPQASASGSLACQVGVHAPLVCCHAAMAVHCHLTGSPAAMAFPASRVRQGRYQAGASCHRGSLARMTFAAALPLAGAPVRASACVGQPTWLSAPFGLGLRLSQVLLPPYGLQPCALSSTAQAIALASQIPLSSLRPDGLRALGALIKGGCRPRLQPCHVANVRSNRTGWPMCHAKTTRGPACGDTCRACPAAKPVFA